MYIESKRFAHDAQEIRPGARIAYQSRLEQQRLLRIITVVESVDPDRWRAEVTFMGEVVLRTGLFDHSQAAGRAAEEALLDRVRTLLGEKREIG